MRRVIAAVSLLVVAATAIGQPLSDRVPENAILYLGWQGTEAMPPTYTQSHLKGILDGSNLPAVFNDMIPRLMQKATAGDQEAVMAWGIARAVGGPMWRHPSAVYFAGVDFQAPAGPCPRFAIICQAGREADALFKQLQDLAQGPLSGLPFPVRTIRLGDIVGLAVGYADDEQAMAGNESPKRPKPISGSARFAQAIGQVQKDAVAIAYADVQALVAIVEEGVRLGDDPDELASWHKVRDALGIRNVQRALMTGGFEGKDWTWQAFVGAPNPRTGLVAMATGKPISDDAIRLVPATATMMEAYSMDAIAILDAMRALGGTLDPEGEKEFDHAMAEINRFIGMDLKKDVLATFGTEWVTYSDPASTGGGLLGTVWANRLRKPAEAEAALKKLSAMLTDALAKELTPQKITIAIEAAKIEGLDVHTLKVPLLAPSWTIKDGVLYIGLFPQAVVASAGYRGKSILDNEKFVSLRKRLGGSNAISISFADLKESAPGAYQFILPVVQLGIGLADMWGVKAPPMVVPPLATLMANLSPMEDGFWIDDAGWHYKALTPFPGAQLLTADATAGVAVAGLTASIMLPALNSAKERAERVKCASDLRQIGQGIMLYANDNNGNFPPDLGTLVRAVDLSPLVFICPTRGTELPAEVRRNMADPAKMAAVMKWVNENSDYVYLGAKFNINNAKPDTILAYDKLNNHERQGINMLFGDGHVEWNTLPRAIELIRKQEGKVEE